MKRKRCAIYTRKSSEEGLSQEFNSLDAQRESCEAYITSQRHEGWHLLQDAYNDGGFSGGTMDRPALVQLLSDIRDHRIDVVVVYKVDRLTRSLSDFARIVDIFDAHDVSFVSVTQSFNTTTSMGRLTLNVLLSFAQYEREVTGERIRDKISASKKKGLWMGGFLPIGYSANGRTLVVLPDQAKTIRLIFERYLELRTVRKLEAELIASGIHAPTRTAGTHRVFGGRPFTRAQLYKLLGNPIYCGEIRHKATRYPGQHEAIIPSDMFQRVQTLLALNTQGHRTGRGSKSPSLLAGLLVDKDGDTLVASHATKAGKRYRYYVARSLHEGGACRKQRDASRSGWRLPADQIEPLVIGAVRHRLLDTSWLIDTAKLLFASDQLLGAQIQSVTRASSELHGKLADGDPVGQREAMLKIIEKIDLGSDSLAVVFKPRGLADALGVQASGIVSQPILFEVPIALRRRGVEMKLILNAPGQLPEAPDATMIRAIARARRWLSDFVEGRYRTIQNIAEAYATDPRYVARHLPLACLSPRIVEAIIAGRQPPELTTWSLLNRIDLPLDWDLQARRLSFDK
ncbi:MAG: recombinase family protein [Hyphomicrobium sp.]